MLIKFESKSNRVKGISFHPKRPWILAALHNGCVQLWDYRMGTLIDKFEEHDGPVRGVAFHPTQPLFVSGGDDYKIKVWNYKQRRCLFTLTGHLDYIRTVFFHHEYPWIISASDDQTIRIWNWQSRQCISILTGHNHYVMCAQFHPKEDLVVSASLDQTIRVWDITGLRKKNSAPQSSNSFNDDIRNPMMHSRLPGQQPDMFGNMDVLVKYVLEGHERGVNWACFHPTLPLIVSGADDRQVKLWRMSDTKAWEVDTCRGHYNNVSCVIFHPRQELILSNSEDKSIRVWDMSKRMGVQTFRRETDRFWVLTAHPDSNLFAAGHDSGLLIFKLERERPAFSVYNDSLFYVKDKYLRHYDFKTSTDSAVLGIKKASGLNMQHRILSYNPAEHSVLLSSPVDGGAYELYALPKEFRGAMDARDASNECQRGPGYTALFVARNRYVVLNKSLQQLVLRNTNNDATRTINLSGNVTDIFYATTATILMSTPTSVILYDLQQQMQVAELQVNNVKYVQWSNDGNLVALMSKHVIMIANKSLEQQCIIHETIRIKSGCWDPMGIFIYSTLNHIKYALPQGDNGIIRTLESTIYIAKSHGQNLFCLDREGKVRTLTIDPTEYRFKLALIKRNYDEVLSIIRNSNLVGQSIIAYLRQKGYPEVALHFVRDSRTRFDLALECANMEVAVDCAKEMDTDECWSRLASVGLKQGNIQVVEMAYQRIKNFDKLSFLYLITGNREKLQKMGKIADLRGDLMSRFHNSLYLGDVADQVDVLKSVGQSSLAYVMAVRHGMTEEANAILEASGRTKESVQGLVKPSSLVVPPLPLGSSQGDVNWPKLEITRGLFDIAGSPQPAAQPVPAGQSALAPAQPAEGIAGDWGGDDDFPELSGATQPQNSVSKALASIPGGSVVPEVAQGASGGGWDLDDEDLELDLVGPAPVSSGAAAPAVATAERFAPPQHGVGFQEWWTKNSALAVDHIAAGSFESAMQLLNRQAGIVNFAPLKPLFMSIYQASRTSLDGINPNETLLFPLLRNWEADSQWKNSLPCLSITPQTVFDLLQPAYRAMTDGRFTEAIQLFSRILHLCLFIVANNSQQAGEIQGLIEIAREYVLGLKLEFTRKELPTDQPAAIKKSVEMAVYFTHCGLQSIHLVICLWVAAKEAYKLKCFGTANSLIRRLLELGPHPDLAQKARKLQSLVEQSPRDEVPLHYDPLNPFVLCARTLQPIYKGQPVEKCAYCGASYHPDHHGSVCSVCNVGQVGGAASGLQLLSR